MKKNSLRLEYRDGRKSPYLVFYPDAGKIKSRSFTTQSEAESFMFSLRNEYSLPEDMIIPSGVRLAVLKLNTECHKRGLSTEIVINDAIRRVELNSYNKVVLVQDCVRNFMAHSKRINLRDKTLKEYDQYLRVRFIPYFKGTRNFATILKSEIEAYIGSSGSQKNNLKVIKALFKFAKREGYITEDVAAEVTLVCKYSDTMPAKILSVEEVKTLLKSVPKEYLAGFVLMTFYGVRPGELIGNFEKRFMQWSDINFKSRVITIQGQTSKVRKQRATQNVSENLWAFLEAVPEKERKGNIIKGSYWKFRKMRRSLPVALSQDVLRHTFATYAYFKFGPQKTVADMGHIRGYATLAQHYMGSANVDDAEKFFSITPQSLAEESTENLQA